MPENQSRSRSPRRTTSSSSSSHTTKEKTSTGSSAVTAIGGSSTVAVKSERESNSISSERKKVDTQRNDKPKSSSGKNFYSGSNNFSSYNSQSGGKKERKFTGRCRLFVGNLVECDEEEMKGMFSKYGEVAEVFINKEKGFGFIRLDTRLHAEAAKAAIDMTQRKGRVVRVRFATHSAALRVSNLDSLVTNELLEQAFAQFGDVERAVVVCDDRGRSKSKGIVEFARKHNAHHAMQKIKENLYLLGRTPRPISVTSCEQEDDEDGLPEKNVERMPGYHKEREVPPHFATPSTFESEWAQRWKTLEDAECTQRETLDKQFKESREKLEAEMQQAIQEHEAMLMRQEIQRRQDELRRFEEGQHREEMMRQEMMHQDMEMRRREEEMRLQEEMRRNAEARRQEEIMFRQKQEELMRRRQEDMLRQESMRSMGGGFPQRGMAPKHDDWGPGPGMGPRGMGPGMGQGPGMRISGGAGNGPPRGPVGPGPSPGMPMRAGRFDQDMERNRERADRERLAARSREPPHRDYGNNKRRKY